MSDISNQPPPPQKKNYLLGGKQLHPSYFWVAALTSQYEPTSVLHKTGSAADSAEPADDTMIAVLLSRIEHIKIDWLMDLNPTS